MTAEQQLLDELDTDKPAAKYFDRGFWRHPVTKAAIVTMPDGARKQLRSPSGDYKNHVESVTALWKWSERQVAAGMIVRGLDGLDLPEDEKQRRQFLDKLALEAKDLAGANAAADKGTHTHLTTELDDEGAHWLTVAAEGEATGLPEHVQEALVRAWRQLIDDHGLEILAVELTVANSEAAGTLDRIARTTRDLTFRTPTGPVKIPKNTTLVLDVKTGRLRADRKGRPLYWRSYAHQIGHYAHAKPIEIDPLDSDVTVWREWGDLGLEPPSKAHALIAHLDVGEALDGLATARLVYVDLADYRPTNQLIRDIRADRRRVPFSDVGSAPDVAIVVNIDGQPLGVTPERISWLQGRINLLGMTDRGRPLLARHWPAGMPPLHKNADITADEFSELEQLVSNVEDEVSAPFGEPDPEAPSNKGKRGRK